MRFFTDGVFVASETDKKLFHLHSSKTENVIAVRGGVDYAFFQSVRVQPRLYDAIFVGRYHPQKNIDELLDIWQAVLMKRPMSQLAIIGGGALEKHLIHKVQQLGISANVKFLGTMDGIMKAKALKAANIFISASKFDSGNLALDESLACGTPGVIYAIPHLQYPAGVIRVPIGDQKAFVSAIESLLGHPEARKALSEAGRKFAATLSWDSKARQAYSFLLNLWGFLK
jgi:glycosyltransferase involved in cell wall biosynthesis